MERDPSPPPRHGNKGSYAKGLTDVNGDGHGIAALGAMLRTMNPYALGNPLGSCEACAHETARVLLTGHEPQPIIQIAAHSDEARRKWLEFERDQREESKPTGISAEVVKTFGAHRLQDVSKLAADHDWASTEFAPSANRPQQVFAWLSNMTLGEKVFVADGGGHVWNFLRVAGRIFLIDVSSSLFRELTRSGDGRATYWARGDMPIPFHYLDPTSLSNPTKLKDLTIYTCGGPMHDRWRRVLLPPTVSQWKVRESPF